MQLKFTIPGTPLGKPRMTQRDRWKKRPCVVRYREWADAARESLQQAGGLPDGIDIMSLSWVAWFPIPRSWTKKKRAEHEGQLHRQRPDRDNIDKAILDAMFKEDSHVAAGHLEKRWCKPGEEARIEIVISYISGAEADGKDNEG